MAVRPKLYYELCNKITVAVEAYVKANGLNPNTVILNVDDYYLLKDTNHFLTGANLDEEPKFAGMQVQVVPKAKGISVGYMESVD